MKKTYIVAISMATVVFICIAFYFFSKKNQDEKFDSHKWVGKRINFPNTLKIIKDTTLFPFDVFEEGILNKNKIVSIIDASCAKCIIDQLNKIDSLFERILNKETNTVMIFVLNIEKSNFSNFMINLYPLIKSKGYLVWDSGYSFETKNDILTPNLRERTFLLNSNNSIVLVGNPIYDYNAIKNYREKIIEHHSKRTPS